MDIHDLSAGQLRHAAAVKEQIERLNRDLDALLGGPAKSRAAPKKNLAMRASTKRKIAASQKARWANLRRGKPPARSVKPRATAKKKIVTRATRAKLAAKLKAYWAAKKAGKK